MHWIDFLYPIEGRLTLAEINQFKVKVGETIVLIHAISPTGIRFYSRLKLPHDHQFVLNIHTNIFGKSVAFVGYVVNTLGKRDSLYDHVMRCEPQRTPQSS